MKEQWLKLAARIDAMALRERVMIFSALVSGMVYVVYMVVAEPMLARQQKARAEITEQQRSIAEFNAQIAGRIASAAVDPDKTARQQLEQLLSEQTMLGTSLRTVQKGLVAPEKMAPLLERILQANGRLKLMALHSLPVTTVNEAAPLTAATAKAEAEPAPSMQAVTTADAAKAVVAAVAEQAAAKNNGGVAKMGGTAGAPATLPVASTVPAPKAREMLYRHGVEMVLQGTYPELVAYMEALEQLPVQLFWGRAQLDAQNYPEVTLTLTLYTLSLDDQWLKL
jgi:MSHA biogenesis protein MshJ